MVNVTYKKRLAALCLLLFAGTVMAQNNAVTLDQNPAVGANADMAETPSVNADAEVSIAKDAATSDVSGVQPPRRTQEMTLTDMAYGDVFRLLGVRNTQFLEFTLRRDQVVNQAELNLVFTPSPALLPRLSHLRVYLNDELMGVVPVDPDEPGARQQKKIALDPRMMTRFNRVRLEFIGHYTDVCQDEAHSALWLDISRDTRIRIEQQMLPLVNELGFFPEPFFDVQDMMPQDVPFVFSGAPGTDVLRAGAILSSYFGSLSSWRRARIPVHYNALPDSHTLVFATNDERPDFLSLYPRVEGPTVDMVSHPDNPFLKMLLILGRNDNDLVTAASALAVGSTVFRGQSVQIGELRQLAPRKPYDAPNWAATDRPIQFSELLDYQDQLNVTGLFPRPISLSLNLPPDLFVWRNSGIPTTIRYRYSAPRANDDSRLSLSLNGRFVDSYALQPGPGTTALTRLRMAVRASENTSDQERILMPALRLGGQNQLGFDFSFTSVLGGVQRDHCQSILPADVRAAIDEESTIDFSGFHHFLEMPNLRSFAGSGFPFSRMADLSETIVVMPADPTASQITTLFETLTGIGSQVGYPAVGVRISHDWDTARMADADVLLIGPMPESMKARPDANLLLRDAHSTLRRPRQPKHGGTRIAVASDLSGLHPEREPLNHVMVQSLAPMAAVLGMQSAHYPQRSVVALLGSTDEDFSLLRDALADSGKREAMRGSVVLIRESGVASEMVGPHYYVGHLPWWQKLWFALTDQPVALAVGAVALVIVLSALLWRGLYRVARRRLRRVDPA